MWQTSESRKRVLVLDESTSLLGKQTHMGSENRKSYYKVLDRKALMYKLMMISQLFLNLKKISKNINTKTSKHTNSFRWIWTLSPNSLLQNMKAKPWIHSFIVATTSEFRHLPGRLNRKGKNILTQQWIPSEKQGKNKNVIKTQKDCTEIPMLFSESGKEVQIFLTKERNKKGAESWKAEAFPQSRNFINLHYLKVTDSTHKTTAGLHINSAGRGASFGICSWL